MLEVDIFDKDILYEIRYGRKDESGWCSRKFYWDQNKALTRYNELKDNWKVELIEYKFDKSFMNKNFCGEFDNLELGQYPNKFYGESDIGGYSDQKHLKTDANNNEISW